MLYRCANEPKHAMIQPRAVTIATLALVTAVSGQTTLPASRPESAPVAGGKLLWPRDARRVIARVDGSDLTLDEMLRHVEERHAPGLRAYMATPSGQRDLAAPMAATWVRMYADLCALRNEARYRSLPAKDLDAALSASLKLGFEAWLNDYVAARQRFGENPELTQERINLLLSRYQREHGLAREVEGLLAALVPPPDKEPEIHAFYTKHARIFGGTVTFAHILIHHRDPVSGELLEGEARERAMNKVAEVRARLRPDGGNFAEVAALLSDDRRTAPRGGEFGRVGRLDDRLPAILCRTAWELADGAWAGPVESPFGIHFVRRISFVQEQFVLYTDAARPEIAAAMRRYLQEELLFDVRARRRVTLAY